ncbi:hypothetical protein AD998_13175 [bacterium 336/3]|nr:hypothetical protein AD998_13175 [bacterium 336/3]
MVKTLHQKLLRLYWALFLLLLSFIIGTISFMAIEGYGLLDALYMCIITAATIGYQEVKPLSDAGKIFNIFYILANLALFAYVISTLTSYLFEGELKNIFRKYKVQKIIQKMEDHIIVCGYGRNGFNVCQELNRLNVPYVLIEKDEHHVEHFTSSDNHQMLIGDATLDETLKEANIDKARALIIALPNDANNVFITLTARELNPKVFIITRASEQNSEKKMYRAGANKVVMPEALGGIHMAQIVVKPEIIEFLDLISGLDKMKLKLEEVMFNELLTHSATLSIKDLNLKQENEASVIALKDREKGFILNPSESYVLSDETILIILGTEDAIKRFKQRHARRR